METEDPHGPYGAKSVGELALVPTPAPIANAIYDAVEVRLTTLPMTPERVLEALKQQRSLASPIVPPGSPDPADPNRSKESDGR